MAETLKSKTGNCKHVWNTMYPNTLSVRQEESQCSQMKTFGDKYLTNKRLCYDIEFSKINARNKKNDQVIEELIKSLTSPTDSSFTTAPTIDQTQSLHSILKKTQSYNETSNSQDMSRSASIPTKDLKTPVELNTKNQNTKPHQDLCRPVIESTDNAKTTLHSNNKIEISQETDRNETNPLKKVSKKIKFTLPTDSSFTTALTIDQTQSLHSILKKTQSYKGTSNSQYMSRSLSIPTKDLKTPVELNTKNQNTKPHQDLCRPVIESTDNAKTTLHSNNKIEISQETDIDGTTIESRVIKPKKINQSSAFDNPYRNCKLKISNREQIPQHKSSKLAKLVFCLKFCSIMSVASVAMVSIGAIGAAVVLGIVPLALGVALTSIIVLSAAAIGALYL